MARPDCDQGWIKYAHELDKALACADFTKGARVVLCEVFAQVFNAGLAAAVLSPSALASATGIDRATLSRAITDLVNGGVLWRLEDGAYRFNKDYEAWTRRGLPRLSPDEVRFCRSAPATAAAYRAGNAPTARVNPVTLKTQNRDDLVTPPVTESSQNRVNPVTQTVTESSHPLSPPYRNAGGIELNLRRETGEEERATSTTKPTTTKAEPDDDERPNGKAEVQALVDWVEGLWPMSGHSGRAMVACSRYRTTWVRKAIEIARNKGRSEWGFVLRVLANFEKNGGTDDELNRPAVAPRPIEYHVADPLSPFAAHYARRAQTQEA